MSDSTPIPPPSPSPGQVPPNDEAGSQALSDALRSSFFIVKIIMALLVLAFLSSGFFTVGPQEKAILLRLGRPVGVGEAALLNPGAHWALPPPIDEIERIPATSVQEAQSSVGWVLSPQERAQGLPLPTAAGPSLDPAASSYAITADTNIIHVVAAMRYHIRDPIHFHFDFVDARIFVTNALNNALLYESSLFAVDDVLTRKRGPFQDAVQERVRELTGPQGENLGIDVDSVVVIDAIPPVFLTAKFNEVDTAIQKRNTARTEAESYQINTLAKARGEAAGRLNMADSDRVRLVKTVDAEAKEFSNVQEIYERDPGFFKRLRQMTALEKIYTNVEEKILEPHQNSLEVRLNLSREPRVATNSFTP